MSEPRFVLTASDGEMHVYDHKVTLRPKGFLTKLSKGSTGDKDVDIRAINAVQLKKPGLSSGFIQLTISGEDAKRGGAFNAAQDENSLILKDARQYAEAEKAKRVIELIKQRDRASSMSPAPEPDFAAVIEKLADLHARGLLTDEEFGAKKAEILARL